MPGFGRAGVYTSEQLLGPQPQPVSFSPSTVGFMGEWWRGPSRAIYCNSWQDFQRFFGGFNSAAAPVLTNPWLGFAIYNYFVNGGNGCWVSRTVASATPGASAAISLDDQAATPQPTLSLTAGILGVSGSVGTWGNQLFVDVVARGTGTGRFDLVIYLGGTTTAFVVERWTDLSMVKNDQRYVVNMLNSTTSGSRVVFATDLGSATAAPNNAPAAVTGTQFTGGTDAGSPNATDRTAALTAGTCPLDTVTGVLNLNLPGESTATVIDQGLTYVSTRQPQAFLVVDTASGVTPAGAVTYEQSLTPVVSNGAVYYPWVTAADPSSQNQQATRLTPPGGFVLGQMVRTDQTRGVWVAPAGNKTILGNVYGTERLFSSADLDTLNIANVNAIRQRPDGSVVIWGDRTLIQSFATMYVPIRRTLNYIEYTLSQILSFALFEPNGPQLWSSMTNLATSFLHGLMVAGAFASNNAASAYKVVCDTTNNTPTSIQQGIVNINVGLAMSYPSEFINLVISQFQGSQTTTTSTSLNGNPV